LESIREHALIHSADATLEEIGAAIEDALFRSE